MDGARAEAEARGGGQDEVSVMPLGAGGEVGRSCIELAHAGRKVLLDCGVHPGLSGVAQLPYFDAANLADVDAVLITHFHIDHCAAVPYLAEKTAFAGKILMTHPTKAVFAHIMHDFTGSKHSSGGGAEKSQSSALFSKSDLHSTLSKIQTLDFEQEVDVGKGIKVVPYRAGHVLGACMFLVDINGFKTLYTGDYSRKPDRHLPGAELPPVSPDLVVIESTFGINTLRPRQEREAEFCNKVERVLNRGGNVLLPVVALGRAQEMMLVLDDHWRKNHQRLSHIPIYNTSSLARRSLAVYQTYVNMLSEEIRRSHAPLKLPYVHHLSARDADAFDGEGPCVVFATPSMLESGLSRDLLESWCTDERNGAVISDFAVPGTLADELLSNNPSEIVSRASGASIPMRMSVDAISFSAHADYPQTQSFLDALAPTHVCLVHGGKQEMGRLSHALKRKNEADGKRAQIWLPANCQQLLLSHTADKVARVVGTLASEAQASKRNELSGLLVRKDFSDLLLDPRDLKAFTRLISGTVRHRERIPCASKQNRRLKMRDLFNNLSSLFKNTKTTSAGNESFSVEGLVDVSDPDHSAPDGGKEDQHVLLEWHANPVADAIADCCLARILEEEEEEREFRHHASTGFSSVGNSKGGKRKRKHNELSAEVKQEEQQETTSTSFLPAYKFREGVDQQASVSTRVLTSMYGEGALAFESDEGGEKTQRCTVYEGEHVCATVDLQAASVLSASTEQERAKIEQALERAQLATTPVTLLNEANG